MKPRAVGHQVSSDTPNGKLNSAKWVALTVAVVGVMFSVMMFIRADNADERAAREVLAGNGEELTRVVEDLQAAGSQQAEALEALFESSNQVTKEEFLHFAEVIGGAASSSLAIAYPAAVSSQLLVPWVVAFESRSGDTGFEVGTDIGRLLPLRDAINRSLSVETPEMSGFIGIPGDDAAGDVAFVSSITGQFGQTVGVALAVLQIDEAMALRAELLLDEGTTWQLREVVPHEESISISTAEHWADTVTVGNQGLVVELTYPSASARRFGAASDWLAVLGIVTSGLLAVLAYNLMKRRSAIRRIEKLEKTLAEKDHFLATVSHELRTPLTAVVGMLEVINDNLDNLSPQQYAPLLGDARDGALELERLIEDYLTAARLSAGALTVKKEVVNLDTIFGRTVVRLNLSESLGVTVRPLGSCVGDSLRIRQIARNILRNAARYADHQIQIENVGDDSFVVIEIRNDGDPVPDDLLAGLFEPFGGSATPGGTEPMGLGLSVSRGLARRMGGDLRYSVDGKWTVFSVVLPVSPRTDDVPIVTREPVQVL
jgi:signal transduction histidine kinase